MTATIDPGPAAAFLAAVRPATAARYAAYWRSVRPKTPDCVCRRWAFAFLSIHVTWRQNVRAYRLYLRTPPAAHTPATLEAVVRGGGVGLVTTRVRALAEFHERFWADPGTYTPPPRGATPAWRDARARDLFGIGSAKVAFAMEMVRPLCATAVCLDTHLLKLYGLSGATVTARAYRAAEAHWAAACAAAGVPSPVARNILWDRVQGRRNTRYWSRVLEPPNRKGSRRWPGPTSSARAASRPTASASTWPTATP